VPKPTMQDVAERAGVSRSLVSLVMRDSSRVSEHSRVAVRRAAEELGYRPDLAARQLASRRTGTLGLILNDLHNPFFSEVTDEIHKVADHTGHRLLISSGMLDAGPEQAALDGLIGMRVDAVLLAGTVLGVDSLEAAAQRVPVGVISRAIPSDHIDTVNNDDPKGASLAVEHLVSLGHERICHLDGGSGAGADERCRGFVEAMVAHGLEPDVVSAGFTERSGTAATEQLLARGELPTAIFAANDLSALGVLGVLSEAGVRVPGDVSVVGHDNTALSAMRYVRLTTVNQDRATLGRLATEAVIRRIGEPSAIAAHHVVVPRLVVRNTTAPPRTRTG
jgi:DNA-binding LacI/PurR family transcriptional regulator